MFSVPRAGLAIVLLAAVLAGCSTAPYGIGGSETAAKAARAEGSEALPRLQPRAIGICYSSAFNELAEVEAEAIYLCDGGRVVKQDEDTFWNGCSLSQPSRISYVCYPPDKAKRLSTGGDAGSDTEPQPAD